MSALYLPAYAKLNLVLRVVGRRDDGYHLLETLFHAIELHDDLWLAAHDGETELEVSADHARQRVGAGDDNLVIRALRRLCDAAGARRGFRARLHKRIPVGGGLGGGSSDAAAALRLGNALLAAPLADAALHAIARGLGADVPFHLVGGSQWGRGIGDELTPAELGPAHFVLLVPPFDCPTAEVYKNHVPHWNDGGPQGTNDAASLPAAATAANRDSALRIGFSNELTAAAESIRPALAALRQRAAALAGSPVHLTGSGSTLFLACEDGRAAMACARRLAPLQDDGVGVVRTRSAPPLPAPAPRDWPDWPDPDWPDPDGPDPRGPDRGGTRSGGP